MNTSLEKKIEEFRAGCKAALWAGNKEIALLYISIICGFRIVLRIRERPEVCAFPPPSFNSHS